MRLPTLLCACGALVLCGCSSDGDDTGPSKGPPPTSIASFGPAASTELTPYPSDRYTVRDASTATGRRLDLSATTTADAMLAAYAAASEQLSSLDGFSPIGGVIVKLTAAIDPRGLVQVPDAEPPILDPVRDASEYTLAGSPLYLVDVDDASPDRGKAVGLVPSWWEQAKDDFWTVDEFTLIAQPAVPLRPRTRYAFVATRALHAVDGTSVGRSPDMDALLTKPPTDDYASELHAALDVLEPAVGIARKDVVVATVFTTADTQRGVIEMARAHRALPAPAGGDPWTIESAKTAGDPRVRFRGTFPAPELRTPKPEGKWKFDASGVPVTQKPAQLETFLAFSDATQSGKRPVVIFQHGLGGDKDGNWGTADRLKDIDARGAAVFSIDSPEHGSRTTLSGTTLVSSIYGFFGIDAATNEFDIERARDNFRQMASDQLELVRFIATLGTLDLLPLDASGQPAPDGVPDLDVSRIFYVGHSFGSVQGPTLAALAPEITTATWNVGGAGLMTLLRDSNTFSIVVKGLAPPGVPFGSVARFMAITQSIVDPGDPLNFARYATLEPLDGVSDWHGTDVLLQMVVDDTIVPNSTSAALARAGGFELVGDGPAISGVAPATAPVTANLPGGNTGAISEFATETTDTGTVKPAVHGDLIFTPEGMGQYVPFFQSAGTAAHATVKAP